jgi:hypothetical protein
MSVAGDVGEQGLTTRPADRSDRPVTALDQVKATGLDYPQLRSEPVVGPDGTPLIGPDGKPLSVQKNANPYLQETPAGTVEWNQTVTAGPGVSRLEGTISSEMEQRAQVCLGAGPMEEAQNRAAELNAVQADREAQRAQLQANGEPIPPELSPDLDPAIPRMLQLDGTDNPQGVMERHRMKQEDPRTGLGYSTTERMGNDVVPGQELTVARDSSGKGVALPGDAQVVTTDAAGNATVGLKLDPATGLMVQPDPAHADPYYDAMKAQSQQNIADAAAKRAGMPLKTDDAKYQTWLEKNANP